MNDCIMTGAISKDGVFLTSQKKASTEHALAILHTHLESRKEWEVGMVILILQIQSYLVRTAFA